MVIKKILESKPYRKGKNRGWHHERNKARNGGKQGGQIMVFLFAKMMDTLPEALSLYPDLGISIK